VGKRQIMKEREKREEKKRSWYGCVILYAVWVQDGIGIRVEKDRLGIKRNMYIMYSNVCSR